MFISPQHAFDQGWITGLLDAEKQIGSDGIDLTLKMVSYIGVGSYSVLTSAKSNTIHRPLELIEPVTTDGWEVIPDGIVGYDLHPGVYDLEFNEFIRLPRGVSALLFLRSTFVRAGHRMFSGLYDQGFENYAGAVVHIEGNTFVEANMRTAQIVFIESAGSGQLYAGGYNHKEGDANWQDAAARTGATVDGQPTGGTWWPN